MQIKVSRFQPMDDISPIKQRRRLNSPPPPPVLPNELIAEILSLLPVKIIARFRCVRKSWNSLISDPNFTKLHLKKSSQNPQILFSSDKIVSLLPVRRLLDNPSSMAVAGDVYQCSKRRFDVIGSQNGLICLCSKRKNYEDPSRYWFYIWNPATRTISEKIGFFRDQKNYKSLNNFIFNFGYDCLTGTYKLVALHVIEVDEDQGPRRYESKIFSLGDNCWRDIQNFPMVPLEDNATVHLNGTINWLSFRDDFELYYYRSRIGIHVSDINQFVIVSLDLSTETYRQLLLPSGFDKGPCYQPSLRIMRDCLCFSHDINGIEFVIWEMKEFGVQESWNQLFRIEYFDLQIWKFPTIYYELSSFPYMECSTPLLPWYLSKDGDTLILSTTSKKGRLFIYNRRDMKVVKTKISNQVYWNNSVNYVESLASTDWKSEDMGEEEAQLTEDDLCHKLLLDNHDVGEDDALYENEDEEGEDEDDQSSDDGVHPCLIGRLFPRYDNLAPDEEQYNSLSEDMGEEEAQLSEDDSYHKLLLDDHDEDDALYEDEDEENEDDQLSDDGLGGNISVDDEDHPCEIGRLFDIFDDLAPDEEWNDSLSEDEDQPSDIDRGVDG